MWKYQTKQIFQTAAKITEVLTEYLNTVDKGNWYLGLGNAYGFVHDGYDFYVTFQTNIRQSNKEL